jgi:hypothetical protein
MRFTRGRKSLATTMRSFRRFHFPYKTTLMLPSSHADEFAATIIPSSFSQNWAVPNLRYKAFWYAFLALEVRREPGLSALILPGARPACSSLNTGPVKRPRPLRHRSPPQSNLLSRRPTPLESVQINPHMQVLSKGTRVDREPYW